MSSLKHLFRGLNIVPIVSAIQRNPQLWNKYTIRTESKESPHGNLDDIWLRYNDFSNFTGDREAFNHEHDSVWYESSDVIPVKPLVMHLMASVRGERLGGVLITRIPAGGRCLPHIDGGWHAGYYEKFAVQLEGDFKQAFCFDGEEFSAVPGDAYWFDNSQTHWVNNDSEKDRMTMIVCIKRQGDKLCHGDL